MSFQSGQILLKISNCTTWLTLPCDLKCSLILFLPIPSLKWWFHLFWFLYIDKHNAKRCRVKGYRHQLRSFKHKGTHKIGYYPKYLLMFTSYQVNGWRTMIINPVKYQQDGSNDRKIYSRVHGTHT